jgi:uncharacterized protein with PhoU and TrkA domain
VAGTVAIVAAFGQRLLPERNARVIPPDLSEHARTLVEEYLLEDGVFWLRVRSGSPYIGQPASSLHLPDRPELALVSVLAGDTGGPVDRDIHAGDMVIVRGDAESVGAVAAEQRLAFRSEPSIESVAGTVMNRGFGLAEVVIPPRSALIGETMYPGMAATEGDLVVLAVRRGAADTGPGGTALAVGDTLLLQGSWEALDLSVPVFWRF